MRSYFGRPLPRTWVAAVLCLLLTACGGGGGGGGSGSTPPPAPPTLTAQPQGAVVVDGQPATLSVSATGAASYQWSLNGTAVPGASGASYTTPALVYGTSYQYSVTVSNAGGATTSQVATLQVSPVAPTITTQPAATSVADGGDAGFGVAVSGSKPLSYQWYRNGAAIAGANGASLTLPAVQLSDSTASVSVQISNAAGNVSSQSAQLTVTPIPAQIVTAPVDQTVNDGATARYAVTAVGSAPLSYQWQLNGTDIPGATSANYAFTAPYTLNGAQLKVRVSNGYSSVTSAGVALKVTPLAPVVSAPPQSYTVALGSNVQFTEAATGTLPLSYQWQVSRDEGRNWTDISGASSATYALTGVSLAHANNRYRVSVSNVAGTVPSPAAILQVTSNVQILAGATGGMGYSDGVGEQARFDWPGGLLVDADGSLIVADSNNTALRRVAADGTVTTIAGKAGASGYVDGNATAARFSFPQGLVKDAAGTYYIAEPWGIRKMSPAGVVSTWVGGPSQTGSADGVGANARFSQISGIAMNAAGDLIVLDGGLNQTVRIVKPDGTVTTLAGTAGTTGYVDGHGAAASFTSLMAVAIDGANNIYAVDNNAIRQITPAGDVSLYAGTPATMGASNGTYASALFYQPRALAFDASGILYVGESSAIRKLGSDGLVSTVAGTSGTYFGPDKDGVGSAVQIISIISMAARPGGGVAFTEIGGSVREFTASGQVTTLAGKNGMGSADVDGQGSNAGFNIPYGVAADSTGKIYVSTAGRIRRVDAAGNVQTLPIAASNCWTQSALAVDASDRLYMVSANCNQVFRWSAADGLVTLAGVFQTSGSTDGPGAQAKFNYPSAVAVDAAGNVFVADMANSVLRRIDTSGNVTTFAGQAGNVGVIDGQGGAARFFQPSGLAFDGQGNLLVSDNAAHVIRKITPDGVVSTIAGGAYVSGVSNGAVTRFYSPRGLSYDATTGDLYIADYGNGLIQRLSSNLWAYPVVGQTGVQALHPGAGGSINKPNGVVVLPNGQIVLVSEQAVVQD